MLVLNRPDGSVVKLLLLRYLLKSETKALDVQLHVQTTQTITFYHPQIMQCRVGVKYIRWECCQVVVIKIPIKKRNKSIRCKMASTNHTFSHSQGKQCRVATK